MIKIALLLIIITPSMGGHPLYNFSDASLIFLNRILKANNLETDKNLERLSGGKIILVDDPANYAVYEMLEKHIRGLEKMIGNKADMISYYRLQDSILGNIIDILQRIRELNIEKLDAILSDSDRDIINNEITNFYDQILYTLSQSEFNNKKLFGDFLNKDIIKNNFKGKEYYNLDNIDKLLNFFIAQRAYTGSKTKSLEYEISGEQTEEENTVNAQSRSDINFPREISNLERNNLLLLINVLMLKQAMP